LRVPLTRCLGAGSIHQRAHPADRSLKPGEHGFPHKEMPNVQFHHLRDGSHRPDSCEIKAVACMHFKAQRDTLLRGDDEAIQLTLALITLGLAIGTRVKLADISTDGACRSKLAVFWIDKEGDPYARSPQACNLGGQCLLQGDHVEAALSGQFRALLGHKATGIRPDAQGKGNHFLGCRHLEIEGQGNAGGKPGDVLVSNVPAVLTQMGGDAIGPGGRRQKCRPQRVGMPAPARIADGRNVIDVNAEAQAVG